MEDAAPEAGRPLQTERSSLRMRVRREETRATSGIETTTKRDLVAGVSTEDHPPGQETDAAVHHPHGITNQETSPRRGEMKNNEKSRVMERRGDDPAAGDALGTGELLSSGKRAFQK